MVNFLSVFLKDLQIKLAPIYQLTRKGIPWEWTEECQQAFDSIKKDLTNPPVLVMPNDKGHFVLVSDTSTVGCGATLYQQIDGEYRVVAYYSKKLPEAVRRYSISELELTGMLANITAFKHILRNVDFTVYCDHSALVHIIKAKREPPTLRLQKLVEHLMDYKFSIKFLKGKEMFVTDFLSRNPDNDTSSPNEIIPIAFLLKDATEEWDDSKPMMRKKLNIVNTHQCVKCSSSTNCLTETPIIEDEDGVFVMTRSMAKTEGATVPKMYPLQGDHKRPEVSQTGMIQTPIQQEKPIVVPQQVEPQPIQTGPVQNCTKCASCGYTNSRTASTISNGETCTNVNTVNTNFPNISHPAHTVNTPTYPTQPVAQPSFRGERDTSANQENLNLPTILATTKGVVPIPLHVKLVGKLPSFEIELDDQEKWMINEVDKNRVRKQLLNKIKVDVDMVRRLLPKQVNLNRVS